MINKTKINKITRWNMKNKLIILDGMCSVGKSTTSKCVYKQLVDQVDCIWLHEECFNHPIREEEYVERNIHDINEMNEFGEKNLHRWKLLVEEIEKSEIVYIMEGCFFHSLDRYLLQCAWDMNRIKDYFKKVLDILKPLNPYIILLYRPDIKASYEAVYAERGDWWKEVILRKPEPYGYFADHEYTGDESVYASEQWMQEQMKNIFDYIECDKQLIDTTDRAWDSYVKLILEYMGYTFLARKEYACDPEKYCGKYARSEEEEPFWNIKYNDSEKLIYTELFWPCQRMRYLGNDCFELISFPAKLHFSFEGEKRSFYIESNYDWDLNDVTLVESKHKK